MYVAYWQTMSVQCWGGVCEDKGVCKTERGRERGERETDRETETETEDMILC